MKINRTPLDGAWVVEAEPIQDNRGLFTRFFCRKELAPVYGDQSVQQINFSRTLKKGAIRGLHFQYPPKAETKLVRCLRGTVFDVMVDLRCASPTFLSWHAEVLSGDNMKMACIPPGFAHGFQTLSETCELLYLHSEFYSPGHEGGIRFDDPAIGIEWPIELTEISERDRNHPLLDDGFEGILP